MEPGNATCTAGSAEQQFPAHPPDTAIFKKRDLIINTTSSKIGWSPHCAVVGLLGRHNINERYAMFFHVTGMIPDPVLLGPYIEEEKAVSLQLQQEGSTLYAVRRLDGPGVFLLIQASDLAEAQANMSRLPFVSAGVMTLSYAEVDRV